MTPDTQTLIGGPGDGLPTDKLFEGSRLVYPEKIQIVTWKCDPLLAPSSQKMPVYERLEGDGHSWMFRGYMTAGDIRRRLEERGVTAQELCRHSAQLFNQHERHWVCQECAAVVPSESKLKFKK